MSKVNYIGLKSLDATEGEILKTLVLKYLVKLDRSLPNGNVKFHVKLHEIGGKVKLHCDLKRHLSPRTVGTIMRSLPLDGNSHLMGKNIVYFETSVDSGIERSRSEFKKGDVAFLPSTGSFCFFVGHVESVKNMTPIGKFQDDNNELKNVKSGDVLRLYEETT